jgi:hypothetical protein
MRSNTYPTTFKVSHRLISFFFCLFLISTVVSHPLGVDALVEQRVGRGIEEVDRRGSEGMRRSEDQRRDGTIGNMAAAVIDGEWFGSFTVGAGVEWKDPFC